MPLSITRAGSYRAFLAAVDECIESAPIVSEHRKPQVSPQEWDCGCITAAYVTDRDFLLGEKPFEMRLVHACLTAECEVVPLIRDREAERQ